MHTKEEIKKADHLALKVLPPEGQFKQPLMLSHAIGEGFVEEGTPYQGASGECWQMMARA